MPVCDSLMVIDDEETICSGELQEQQPIEKLSDDDVLCVSDDYGTCLSNDEQEESSVHDKQRDINDDDDATPINEFLLDQVSTFFARMLH